MLTILRLALRNVARHTARSALTLGAVGLGVTMTLLLGGFIQGFQDALIDDAIRGRVGAFQVRRAGLTAARDDQKLTFVIEADGDVARRLRAVDGVEAVSPRLSFPGLLSNGTDATLVRVVAADPALEQAVVPLAMASVQGRPLTPRDRAGHLGDELYAALVPTPGTQLTLQATSAQNRQNALDLEATGKVASGSVLESKRQVWVPLAFAQELLRLPGRATELAVSVRDPSRIDAVAAAARAALGPDYVVETWGALKPGLSDLIKTQDSVLGGLSLVFVAIAALGVANTMLMSVMERTREIGTMLAVGLRRRQIRALFLCEAAWQAGIGGALGAILGVSVLWAVHAAGGFIFSAPGGSLPLHILPRPQLGLLALALGASTVGALLAALAPAQRAARLTPVEALRSN
jgi:putative ABC transport system permease protein